MPNSENSIQNIDQALAVLGKAHFSQAEQAITKKVQQQIRTEKRQTLLSIAGLLLALLAEVVFILKKEPFGYFAMSLIIAIFLGQIYYSRKLSKRYELDQGEPLLALIQSELRKTINHYKYLGPFLSLMFTLLTAFVVAEHGFSSARSWLYIVTTLCIGTYIIYRSIVTIPELQKELEQYQSEEV